MNRAPLTYQYKLVPLVQEDLGEPYTTVFWREKTPLLRCQTSIWYISWLPKPTKFQSTMTTTPNPNCWITWLPQPRPSLVTSGSFLVRGQMPVSWLSKPTKLHVNNPNCWITWLPATAPTFPKLATSASFLVGSYYRFFSSSPIVVVAIIIL